MKTNASNAEQNRQKGCTLILELDSRSIAKLCGEDSDRELRRMLKEKIESSKKK
jgi:hypothetical protein